MHFKSVQEYDCQSVYISYPRPFFLPESSFSSGASLEMEKGHISLVPYSVVENLVARGEVELI